MSDAYFGEIRMFGGNYAPRNWAFCNGALLPISQHNALFSLLGTCYGGDGRSNFGLPDMRGRIPMHKGTGPGLTPRFMGQYFGDEDIVLSIVELPEHSHTLQASRNDAISPNPANDLMASQSDGDFPYTDPPSDSSRYQTMNSQAVASAGGSQAHCNMMPYLCVSFIICITGLYPPRH